MSPAMRSRACAQCGKDFSYRIGKGTDRKYCRARCRGHAKAEQRRRREAAAPTCTTPNCRGKAVRPGARLCERCYMRQRRHGSTNGRARLPKYRYVNRSGYISVVDRGHPLADRSGQVLEHRRVLYAKYGPSCPPCHWCGRTLTWDQMRGDHVDGVPANNAPDNLVPSCNTCNVFRGNALAFAGSALPGALKQVIEMMESRNRERSDVSTEPDAGTNGGRRGLDGREG